MDSDISLNSKTLGIDDKAVVLSILIIDDEKSNIMTLSHYLRSEFNIFVTKNSKDALEMAEAHIPDIILLDILMPEMDGYEVFAALKKSEKTKNIPVIFISGLTDDENISKGMALGAADYIQKPFEASDVRDKIMKILTPV